jgi:hypothetical protein
MGVYLYDWSYEELKSIFDKAEETQIGAFTKVKTPHGRLVDLDALVDDYFDGFYMEISADNIDEISVIIETEVE